MGWQHLSVSIHVDAFSLSLIQNFLQVLEVVTRHKDGFPLLYPQWNRGRDGMTIGFRVGVVKQLHYAKIDFAALQDQANELINREVRVQGGC